MFLFFCSIEPGYMLSQVIEAESIPLWDSLTYKMLSISYFIVFSCTGTCTKHKL